MSWPAWTCQQQQQQQQLCFPVTQSSLSHQPSSLWHAAPQTSSVYWWRWKSSASVKQQTSLYNSRPASSSWLTANQTDALPSLYPVLAAAAASIIILSDSHEMQRCTAGECLRTQAKPWDANHYCIRGYRATFVARPISHSKQLHLCTDVSWVTRSAAAALKRT